MTGTVTQLIALESSTRNNRFMAWSLTAHVVVFLLALLIPREETEHIQLTEISFLEPGEALAAAPAAASAPAPAAAAAPAEAPRHTQATEDQRFERTRSEAEISPRPQSSDVVGDQMSARLSKIQQMASERLSGADASDLPTRSWAPAGSGTNKSLGPSGSSVSLNRGRTGGTGRSTQSLQLTRGTGTRSLSPATMSTGIPSPGARGSAPAEEGEVHARKQLAGATLMGPIADRPILKMSKPGYPDWAKREAIEASVTVRFVVRPDGRVREGVEIQKTAGFQDFDENARRAIQTWQFQALGPGQTGDQWGSITFHFRLKDAS